MTHIMGILNLTPDSFSGDGTLDPQAALERINNMVREGAHVIDVGAESTRPNATPLKPDEEWRRIAALAERIQGSKINAALSIDTRHAEVAKKALAAGFGWINDVSGGGDPAMLPLAAESGCTIALMHSCGVPADPARTLPVDSDPMDEVLAWAEQMLKRAESAGVARANIVLDPGIGFGKTAKQSLALIKDIARLVALGVPVMVGHSRKSFLTLLTDKKAEQRDPETLAVSRDLVAHGVAYLRVHDVKGHAAMLRTLQT